MPYRPDVDRITKEKGKAAGCIGAMNSWVIESLVENDLMVVDLFGRVDGGDFLGDNLANSVYAKSKTGMVINGSVRDIDGIYEIENFNAYIRGYDPAVWFGVMIMGINGPDKLGQKPR